MNKESLALSICETLVKNHYIAYFAGGCVRDRLLNIPSDDIDIATDAPPEVIQSLFKKTLPLGISFGIIVVIEKGVPFEVATFRKDLGYQDGRRPDEVAFSSPEEDAKRRDFTINGLFYDPLKKKLLDYVEGEKDLKLKILRAIGDPQKRFEEDRLRMIRAARFAARFHLTIESDTKHAVLKYAPSLFPSVSVERIYQEFKKMLNHCFKTALKYLWDFGLFQVIFSKWINLDHSLFLKRIDSFDHFPEEAPVLLYLLVIFEDFSIDDLNNLSDFLKLSNQETALGALYLDFKTLLKKEPSSKEWVHFLAKEGALTVVKSKAATLEASKKDQLLKEVHEKLEQLHPHIERRKLKKPLLSATHLLQYGMEPGKHLGELLDKAEELAIYYHCQTPEEVLNHLKKTALWKNK